MFGGRILLSEEVVSSELSLAGVVDCTLLQLLLQLFVVVQLVFTSVHVVVDIVVTFTSGSTLSSLSTIHCKALHMMLRDLPWKRE